uniref:GRAM domain-containing protein n=1 Tax=Scophthalmus maximus TaxID=52904 RepID=A0A8D3C1S2_SCOMX
MSPSRRTPFISLFIVARFLSYSMPLISAAALTYGSSVLTLFLLLPGDSSLDGAKKGGNRFGSKKSRHSLSLDDARQEIQELNHSLNSNMSAREKTIPEETHELSHELLNHSLPKHNKSFHKLFHEIPEWENLTQMFICALQKEVLYHGKLFVSENYVCFYSSVLLKDTKVVIPTSSIREVKKHNPALSMLSIHTADGEKYSFVSLRNREMCYKLLQSETESPGISPQLSSADNEADQDLVSSYSSLEDSVDHDLSRQNSVDLDTGFPHVSSEAPTRCRSTAVSWIWRVVEKVALFVFHGELRNLGVLFYIYLVLIVLLLLVSGYIGLRIIALEEQLNSLGALTELSLGHREYQET